MLAASLDQPETSRLLVERAAATYRRLGAAGWLAEVRRGQPSGIDTGSVSMRRRGPVWELTFSGRDATVPHTKGLTDIARLVAAGGDEIHALELMDAADRSGGTGDLVDRSALDAYRQRLTDLEDNLVAAERNNDPEPAPPQRFPSSPRTWSARSPRAPTAGTGPRSSLQLPIPRAHEWKGAPVPIATRVTAAAFGCPHPLQQAGMGGIATPDLALAVARAGGLGMLAGTLGLEALSAPLDAVPAGAAVGVLVPFLDRTAVEEAGRGPYVEFFWGESDRELVRIAGSSGAMVGWQVGSAREAVAPCDAGCDPRRRRPDDGFR